MKQVMRYVKLIFGLMLYGFGSYLNIQANIGLAPWEAFQMGLSKLVSISYGNMVVIVGLVILVIDSILGERVGVGTCLNILLIGKFVDFFAWLDLVPMVENFWIGLIVLVLGQVIVCVGTYFYISPGLGCGPRDALMVALGKLLKKIPIGVVRGTMEGTVLLIGWLLGSKVGIGTIISVFGISFILQMTFHVFRFDVKSVRHENLLETFKIKS